MDPDHHYETCGGRKQCDHCRAILSETADETVERLAAENRARSMRSASDGTWQLRTNVHPWKDGQMDTNDKGALRTTSAQRDQLGIELQGFGSVQLDAPPDPYAAGLAKLRAAQGIPDAPDHTDALRAMADFRSRLREQTLTAGLELPPATGDIYANPSDPCAAAITKIKEKALAAHSKKKTRCRCRNQQNAIDEVLPQVEEFEKTCAQYNDALTRALAVEPSGVRVEALRRCSDTAAHNDCRAIRHR